jgi:sarcosine oxidase
MIRYPYGSAAGLHAHGHARPSAAWDRVWSDLGTAHFENTGAIAISLEAGDYAQKTLDSFKAVGQPHEVLSRDGVEALCPHLSLPECLGRGLFPRRSALRRPHRDRAGAMGARPWRRHRA